MLTKEMRNAIKSIHDYCYGTDCCHCIVKDAIGCYGASPQCPNKWDFEGFDIIGGEYQVAQEPETTDDHSADTSKTIQRPLADIPWELDDAGQLRCPECGNVVPLVPGLCASRLIAAVFVRSDYGFKFCPYCGAKLSADFLVRVNKGV